jgi:hypothetical protein
MGVGLREHQNSGYGSSQQEGGGGGGGAGGSGGGGSGGGGGSHRPGSAGGGGFSGRLGGTPLPRMRSNSFTHRMHHTVVRPVDLSTPTFAKDACPLERFPSTVSNPRTLTYKQKNTKVFFPHKLYFLPSSHFNFSNRIARSLSKDARHPRGPGVHLQRQQPQRQPTRQPHSEPPKRRSRGLHSGFAGGGRRPRWGCTS